MSSGALNSLDAALAFDLKSLANSIATLSSVQLRATASPSGPTLAHAIPAAFTFFKAGELSTLVPWPNGSRTIYAHDVRGSLGRAVRPVLRALLVKAPSLARAADGFGVTPLHLASMACADDLVEELLRAGGLPHAQTHGDGRRTPIDDAMMAGCIETLGPLLSALSRLDPSAHREAVGRAVEYARLPGAALSLRALQIQEKAALEAIGITGTIRPRQPILRRAPRDDVTGAACAEGGGWNVEAPPSEADRSSCQIEQLDRLSSSEYHTRFFGLSRPVLIRGALSLRQRCVLSKDGTVMAGGPATRSMRCGRTAYPTLTGQRTCGVFTLEALDRNVACKDRERTRPVCALKPQGGVNRTAIFSSLPVRYRLDDAVPPIPVLSATWGQGGSRQLFAGGQGSGAALHFHNPAYNVQFFGVKKWLLTPPRYTGITGATTSRPEWLEEQTTRHGLPSELPLRCTQGPGDMLLLPAYWGHATINRGFTIGIGNLYCDRLLANYTHDPTCKRFYPQQARPQGRRPKRSGATAILQEALGGQFDPTGAYEWPKFRTQPLATAPTSKPAATASATHAWQASARSGLRKMLGVGLAGGRLLNSSSLRPSSGHPSAHLRSSSQLLRLLGSSLPPGVSGGLRSSSPSSAPATTPSSTTGPRPTAVACVRGAPEYRPVAFVHINKAGGTWMRARLFKGARHQMLETSSPAALGRMRQLGSRFFHASAALQREALGAAAWDAAYTFALVRNPYARQVSMFHFLLMEASCNKPIGSRPSHCEERKLPAAGPWLHDPAQVIAKFRKWIRDLATAFPSGSRDEHLFGARSHGNERSPWYNASQVSWLVDRSGHRLVKQVFRLEDLESKWPELQKAVCGLRGAAYTEDADLRRNPSRHAHYSTYYDGKTKEIIDRYVAIDLKVFGYAFEAERAGKR